MCVKVLLIPASRHPLMTLHYISDTQLYNYLPQGKIWAHSKPHYCCFKYCCSKCSISVNSTVSLSSLVVTIYQALPYIESTASYSTYIHPPFTLMLYLPVLALGKKDKHNINSTHKVGFVASVTDTMPKCDPGGPI